MIKLKIPDQISSADNTIPQINDNIKDILSEVLNFQIETINSKNENKLKELLNKADLIIVECHNTKPFKISKNTNFSKLIYEYQRLRLKYESYRINKQIDVIHEEYNSINKQQDNIKLEMNNLVYNILGFIASFSIVAAAVSAIEKLQSLSSIMLFMAFTAFILLTTLIGLHNFYKNNNSKNILQSNYFLWTMIMFVIILIIGYKGIEYFRVNRESILKEIGSGIDKNIIEEIIQKEIAK